MIPRDAMTLLYVSIPFFLAAGALFVIGEFFAKGWSGLSFVIYGALVFGAWAVLVVGWCGWIVLRDGLVASSLLPGVVLTAVLVGGGLWGGTKLLEQRRCTQSATFFTAYAQASAAERPALIAANRRFIAEPTRCGLDAVQYWLGLDLDGNPVVPGGNAGRLAALRELLAAGLEPADVLLYYAARAGDVAAVRLIAEFRRTAGLDPWPLRSAVAALQGYEAADTASPLRPRHLETLRQFVAAGTDVCAPTETGQSLAKRMTRAGLAWRDWQAPAGTSC